MLKNVFEVADVRSLDQFCIHLDSNHVFWLDVTFCMSVRLSLLAGSKLVEVKHWSALLSVKAYMYGRHGSVWCLDFVEVNKLA